MSSLACAVAGYVVNAIWEIPLIAIAGWAASRVLRRWGPQAQHAVWVAALLLSVVTPVFPSWGALFRLRSPETGMARVSVVAGGAWDRTGAPAGAMLLPDWAIWLLCGAYLCALVYSTMRLLWLTAATAALVRESVPVILSQETASVLESGLRAFGVKGSAVLSSEKVRGVATVGWRNPAILLPAGFLERCAESDCLSAVGHELAHIRRRDYPKNLFYEVVGIAVAFHPLTWWMKARIVETREMICDAMVVEKLVERRSYRQSLLRLAQRMLVGHGKSIHAVGILDANVLEKRIMIMKTKRAVLGRAARGALAVCAVLLLGSAVASSAFARGVAADHDAPYGPVYHPGDHVSNPVLTYAPDPEFPTSARNVKVGFATVCVVAAIVDHDGMPREVHVTRSAGKDFDASALKAVQQYRFKPGVRFGTPVAVAIHIEVNFRKY